MKDPLKICIWNMLVTDGWAWCLENSWANTMSDTGIITYACCSSSPIKQPTNRFHSVKTYAYYFSKSLKSHHIITIRKHTWIAIKVEHIVLIYCENALSCNMITINSVFYAKRKKTGTNAFHQIIQLLLSENTLGIRFVVISHPQEISLHQLKPSK